MIATIVRNALIPLGLGAAAAAAACAPPPLPAPDRTPAPRVLDEAEGRYAAIERFADGVAAHEYADAAAAAAPAEFARAAARNLAVNIAAVRDELETVTVAMSTEELERTQSLWMRLALGQAALELLYEDAVRLSRDAAVSGAEVADLAERIAASSALARASARMAAGTLRASRPALTSLGSVGI